jgi:16S rRNA (guanine966-N2)-methyltransferase
MQLFYHGVYTRRMRITGGVYRSRSLRAPRGDATRPTSDRVREALFAILGSQRTLEGCAVLDLYAGTGALGFEALSRGARAATFVESARAAIAVIHANAGALRLEARARVVPVTVERCGDALGPEAPFDLVFADPPYAMVESGAVTAALERLVGRGVLAEGGILVLEHGKAAAPPSLAGLAIGEARRYGDTALAFYAAPGSAGGG